MTRPVVLLGAGGHARVVAAGLRAMGRAVIAVAAPDGAAPFAHRLGVPVLADDAAILALDPAGVELALGIGMVTPSPLRRQIFERFCTAGFRFVTVVHPAAFLDRETTVGAGSVVMAGAIVQTGVRVGEGAIINTGAIVEHDCAIGAFTHVATGCVLAGGVQVGAGVHLGAGATIIQGLSIGDGVLVAAGAVVIADLPAGVRVAGIPARNMKLVI